MAFAKLDSVGDGVEERYTCVFALLEDSRERKVKETHLCLEQLFLPEMYIHSELQRV